MRAIRLLAVALASCLVAPTLSANDPKLERVSKSFMAAVGIKPVDCGDFTGDSLRVAHVSCGLVGVSLNQLMVNVPKEIEKRKWTLDGSWHAAKWPVEDEIVTKLQSVNASTANHLLTVNVVWSTREIPTGAFIMWVAAVK